MKKTESDLTHEEQPLDESANMDSSAEFVVPFNSEELRLKLQKNSERQQSEEHAKQRRRMALRAFAIIILSLTVLILIVWAGNVYQTNKLEQQAALTKEALAAKYQSANGFMSAERPEEALRLYNEIKKIDPLYKDIDQKIKLAKESIAIIALYQQGVQALNEGKSDKALEILSRVENQRPKYKDTPQLIQRIKQEQQIASLIAEIKKSYSLNDWAGVIRQYEAIQAVDPFIQIPELKDILFVSYRNLILDLAERSDLTLEDIDAAERYYRSARALVPQDKAYAKEREELQKIAVERLANKYYLNAINLLESSNYSINGLRESLRILTKANNIGSDAPAIKSEIEKAQLFLDAYNNLLQLKWDDVISDFETLRRKEENYADGRVKYFLYEAYIARGDMFFAYADFGSAFADYQEAEKIAWGDQGNLLRLFQIETRIGATLGKLGKGKESAEFYRYAFEKLAYQNRFTNPDQALVDTLNQADAAYKKGDMSETIRLYEMAMKQEEKFYDQITIEARQGDILANIAFENGSTIEGIRAANQIGESMIIGSDQKLLIPVISTDK
ncbi:MAG: hypothetical protein PHQ36_13050 [Anaerolineales bacterium]|nr:hypothetical protein [Anaerolineales bacterium]